ACSRVQSISYQIQFTSDRFCPSLSLFLPLCDLSASELVLYVSKRTDRTREWTRQLNDENSMTERERERERERTHTLWRKKRVLLVVISPGGDEDDHHKESISANNEQEMCARETTFNYQSLFDS